MASPLSIGDILLLTKISYRLLLAFTSGRSSAPAEFQSLETELSSLHSALSSISTSYASHPKLQPLLTGTKQTLSELEKFVEKYSIISPSDGGDGNGNGNGNDKDTVLRKRKWTKSLRANFRRIKWTTEEGAVKEFRDKLGFHAQCIQLAIGALAEDRGSRIEGKVKEIAEELALQKVATVNNTNYVAIVNTKIASEKPGPGAKTERVIEEVAVKRSYRNKATFMLEVDAGGGSGGSGGGRKTVLCPKAAVALEWSPSQRPSADSRRRSERVFVCLCKDESEAQQEEHKILVDIYFTPTSYCVHLTGQSRRWVVHPTGDRQGVHMRTLYIRGIAATHIDKFERKFVSRLNIQAAREQLARKLPPTAFIAYASTSADDHRILFLHSMSDDTNANLLPATVNTRPITTLQLLHYCSLPVTSVLRGPTDLAPSAYSHAPAAELTLHLQTQESVAIQITPTAPLIELDRRQLLMHNAGGKNTLKLLHPDSAAAAALERQIADMRSELLFLHHSQPRIEETIVLTMYLGDLEIANHYHLQSADLTLLWDDAAGTGRILLRSGTRTMTFSRADVTLDNEFLEAVEHGQWLGDEAMLVAERLVKDGVLKGMQKVPTAGVRIWNEIIRRAWIQTVRDMLGATKSEFKLLLAAEGVE